MRADHIYCPLIRFHKSVTGAVKEGKNVIFRIKKDCSGIDFVCHKDNGNSLRLPMKKKGGYFEIAVSFSVGLFWYCFDLRNGFFIGCGDDLEGIITDSPKDFQLTVYSKDYSVPKWLKGGIIYQIFPDRFYRFNSNPESFCGRKIHDDLSEDPCFLPDASGEVKNDDFFGGTIKGITEKLPYLSALNVSVIYLNPIFEAFSNHRYDTGDFMRIDLMLGTENDLRELIEKASISGISVILDGVFNHVGADSVYFNKYGRYDGLGAYQSKDSKYFKWFDFTDFPDEYRSWWGVKTLPAVNKENRDYIDFICGKNGVIKHYLDLGIKGLRLDVVDELPQNFVRELRKCMKDSDKNAVIIGEVWEDASNKISYGKRREYFLGKELDSVMNYPLKNAIIDFVRNGNAALLSNTVKTQTDHYPKFALDSLMNILSTHDTARILSAVSDYDAGGKTKSELAKVKLDGDERENAVFRLKAASLLQYALYGVPCVYYGDEIGMQGFFDPINRRYFAWDDMDEEILSWYKLLGKIRRGYSVFKTGRCEEIYSSYGFYAFTRKCKGQELLALLNVKNGRFTLKFKGKLVNILDGAEYFGEIKVGEKFLGIFKKPD